MRINEIDNSDDILCKVQRYIRSGQAEINNGLIDVYGDFEFTRVAYKLPFKFGKVTGNFIIGENKIETLEGCPYVVGENFDCGFNRLDSLIGGPTQVMGDYLALGNSLSSLDGLAKEIHGAIHLEYNENLPMLKLFFVKNLTGIMINTSDNSYKNKAMQLEAILTNYIGKGPGGALACAAELIKARFNRNARK